MFYRLTNIMLNKYFNKKYFEVEKLNKLIYSNLLDADSGVGIDELKSIFVNEFWSRGG